MERIKMNGVTKKIKEITVLHSVDLEVSAGEICAIIGPNGAGKTTLLKCLLGLINYDEGYIEINGKELTTPCISEQLSEVGAVLQFPSSILKLTIDELFTEHFQYFNLPKPKSWDKFLCEVGLKISVNKRISTLSLGMKQRLLFALSLSHNPNIVILDEPFNGLDVDGITLLKEIFDILKRKNISIIVTSHSLSELENIATSVVFMLKGKTFNKKNINEIIQEYEGGLKQYYQQLKKEGIEQK